MYHIVILGPQGAGKGTQAQLIAKQFNIPAVSTGEIYRQEIDKQTDLGKMAISFINQGKLAPDELTNDLVRLRLQQADCQNGFVLDGYPRNAVQLGAMETMAKLNNVLEIDISDEEAVKRLGGRRACSACGRIFHLIFKPAKKEGICDDCNSALIRRGDDEPEAIRERLKIYHQDTEPLLGFYQGKGILHKINGEQSIEKVFEDILKVLK